MGEECLICKAPLEYIGDEVEMECAVCGGRFPSRARCVNGHYVCDGCHTGDMDEIIATCLGSDSRNPSEILEKLMQLPGCHMHGPEHHVMVGSALLTAYRNSGGDIDLAWALREMRSRGKQVPGGVCGFWGACGAAVSTGMFISIVTGSTPLAGKAWGLSNTMTSESLGSIGSIGGPRCCKRNSNLAIMQAVGFVERELGVKMEMSMVTCTRSGMNSQCIGDRCPFHPGSE